MIRLLAALLIAAASGISCPHSAELAKQNDLHLAVYFESDRLELRQAFVRALNFWARVIDMEWHPALSKELCDIELVDGKPELFGPTDVARAPRGTGTVAFDAQAKLSPIELYGTCVHELGHLFGLHHNPSNHSVMFFMDVEGDEVLDADDLMALARVHRLRGIPLQ